MSFRVRRGPLVFIRFRVMCMVRVVSRCVPLCIGMALIASTAAASPLSAAVDRTFQISNTSPALSPKHAILREGRRVSDQAAALEAVQYALSRVADGSLYIWHRPNGLMSGSVKPTATFKAANGMLCRHLVVEISSEEKFRTMEGIACRGARGIWRLDG